MSAFHKESATAIGCRERVRDPRRRSSRGTAAIEFALILPLFALMLLGMMDYGWFFFVDLLTTNATREGARVATTYSGCTGTAAGEAAIQAAMTSIKLGANATITSSCVQVGPNLEPQYTYNVVVDFPRITGSTIVPMPSSPTAGNVTLRTSATMRGWN